MKIPTKTRNAASFRDPSGFVFTDDSILYRQVNTVYQEHYDHLMHSGLYQRLVNSGLLIPHEESNDAYLKTDNGYKIIQPQHLHFISYPYEWCFSQLKDAALVTLNIQKQALQYGMILKDASAYNIQFVNGHPLLIDTLSFEIYQEGAPWIAYRQFCQHFLAPLALMAYKDVRLGQMLRTHMDGIPLDVASTLLPHRTYLRPGLLMHLHLHARSQRRYATNESDSSISPPHIKKRSLLGIVDNLKGTIESLLWQPEQTAWANYYQGDSYNAQSFEHKQDLVMEFIDEAAPTSLWDLGANTGVFSRIASSKGIPTIAWDIDPGAVELNYRQIVTNHEQNILPLLIDLTNPSPAIGWANAERESFTQRSPVDAVLALALIHHLAIANNVPLDWLARFFAGLTNWLIIEFVPRHDPKVNRLLANRQDIFPDYTREGFEAAFASCFAIIRSESIQNSQRYLYLMRVH